MWPQVGSLERLVIRKIFVFVSIWVVGFSRIPYSFVNVFRKKWKEKSKNLKKTCYCGFEVMFAITWNIDTLTEKCVDITGSFETKTAISPFFNKVDEYCEVYCVIKYVSW